MQLDFAARELTIKLVYYGPALSGKTTNLVALHEVAASESTGRLMTLETKDDRTLFFDLLPLTFKGRGDLSVRLKVFTLDNRLIVKIAGALSTGDRTRVAAEIDRFLR